jgi:hypothetical protein
VIVSSVHPEPPSRSGRRLTRLLARWAEAHRLDARRAETIRQQVLVTSTPRDFDWWWRLLAPEDGTAFRAMPSSSSWQSFPGVSAASESPAAWPPGLSSQAAWSESAWNESAWSPAAWSHDDADFQPYLRLT